MNPVFRVVLQQAKQLITNPKKAKRIMDKARKKSGKVDSKDVNLVTSIRENVTLFVSMLGDFFTGKYRKIPLKSGIKILGALLYFVFIVDLIPDFFAVIGLTDDVAVMAWVIASISGDIEKYKNWKDAKESLIEDAEIVE